MKIGILECGRMPDVMSAQVGQYPPMFMRLLDGHGFDFQTWHVEGMEFPESVAQALGGRVEKFAGGWAVGPQDYTFDVGPVRLNAWHQDQVVIPPDSAQTVGHNAFCAHAALIYPGKGFSVQAHPEFSDAVVQGLIDHRGPGVVPKPLLQAAQDGLGRADSQALAERIADFFTHHATRR